MIIFLLNISLVILKQTKKFLVLKTVLLLELQDVPLLLQYGVSLKVVQLVVLQQNHMKLELIIKAMEI